MASKKHAELIRAWLDGAQIQYLLRSMNRWVDTEKPNFEESEQFRIKPAEPERRYPVVMIDGSVLEEKLHALCSRTDTDYHDDLQSLASWVVRELCDSGQIVTREEFDRAVGHRNLRDMAVAEAVYQWFVKHECYPDGGLYAIIKDVK